MLMKNIQELGLPVRFTEKLNRDLTYLLKYKDISIEQIILFGSCARGTYKVTSDLDLLAITEESVERYIRGDIASELDEEVDGVRTDIVFYSRHVFDTSHSLLVQKIKQEGIIIYKDEVDKTGGYYAAK